MHRRTTAPALLLAAALALAGCAGEKNDVEPVKTKAAQSSAKTITCESSSGEKKTVKSLESAWEMSEDQRWHCTTKLSDAYEATDGEKVAMTTIGEAEDDLGKLQSLNSLCAMYNFNNDPGEDLSDDDSDLLHAYVEACPDQPEIENVTDAIAKQDAKAEKEAAAKAKAEAKREAKRKKTEARELKATTHAYGEDEGGSGLETLRDICAADLDYQGVPGGLSEGQIKELEGAVILCPNNKGVGEARKLIQDSKRVQAEVDAGTRFSDGTYQVGKDVQPGVYVSSGYPKTGLEDEDDDGSMDGCYWERLDSNGNIIDNNFVNKAFRVQATIGAGDYSFTTENCGEWVRQ